MLVSRRCLERDNREIRGNQALRTGDIDPERAVFERAFQCSWSEAFRAIRRLRRDKRGCLLSVHLATEFATSRLRKRGIRKVVSTLKAYNRSLLLSSRKYH